MTNNKKCILILGMHRSGTSALTGLLNIMGVNLGTELMKPADDNPKGFFENLKIVQLNELLLERLVSSWDDLDKLSPDWQDEEYINNLHDYAKDILIEEYEDRELFSIKDPRMCILFPFWKRVFEDLNIELKIILPYRNIFEVASSLQKRNDMNFSAAIDLWSKYVLTAEFYSRDYKRIFISYEELLNDTQRVINSIENGLEVSFPIKFNDIENQINTFLDKNLKHESLETKMNIMLPIYAQTGMTLYLDAIEKNTNNESQKMFDKARDEYNEIHYNKEENKKKIKYLNSELVSVENKLSSTQNELTSVENELTSVENELNAVSNSYQELSSQLEDIYSSKSWKFIIKIRKIKTIIMFLFMIVKSPRQIIRQLDKQKLKRLLFHIRTGNFTFLKERTQQLYGYSQITKNYELFEELITDDMNKTIIFDNYDKPLVSIVIPVYNEWRYTYRCLYAIKENTKNIRYEIIIGDDCSTDETVNILEHAKNIELVRNEVNLGFLKNCNNAATRAKGKYILFLNNDTSVQNGWLDALLQVFENDENAGMVGSKLVYKTGQLQEAGGIVWNDASAWNYGRLASPDEPEYNYVKEVDYISGASIMIKKDLWETIGAFDERYVPAYYEDADLAFEVRKHGYKVFYQPKSVVVHFEGISNGTDTSGGIKKYQVVNREKFYDKWKDVLEKEHFTNADNVFSARDRSRDKKVLLWIDHYVPLFDQDAGSRATLDYLNLFIESGFIVKFLGDNFAYDKPYVEKLESMGIEVLYGPKYATNWKTWIKENGSNIDYTVLSRPHIAKKYIDFIKQNTKSKLIYTGVDLHYLREEREFEVTKNSSVLQSSKEWKKLEYSLMKDSDVSLFYSDVEIKEIAKEDETINAVQIPLFIYPKFERIVYNHDDRKDILFIGGFTHTPNEDAIIWYMQEVYPLVSKEINSKFIIVGSNPTNNILKFAEDNDDVIVTGRISDEELEKYYRNCRLAIAPLRFGAGIKGKVVEAMYNQIPLVTTTIGAEGLYEVENSVLIADEAQEFASKVIDIYRNEELALKLSENSLEYSKNNFSHNAAKKAILNAGLDLNK